MRESVRTHFDFTGEPIRRGFPNDNVRLELKGNFHRIVEVTGDSPARLNARRGI
jgi:hypothetical protein